MRSWIDAAVRILGIVLVALAMTSFFRAMVAVDRREFVSGVLALLVGWLLLQAGIEFVRSESAE
ncbi:MAG: hypothetical protein Q8Q09_11730 [Deltaproteobacteria bacterium]|nr:hypothetical protein [Deltaproteobacteria bacterium]